MPKFKAYHLALFLWGCLISAVSFLFIFFLEFSSHTFVLNDTISFFPVLNSTLYCVFIAILEEFLFRYLFLKKWIVDKTKPFSKRVVYLGLISSLTWSFLHLNLDFFPIMQINTVLSGLSLFFATYLFRSISMAIGMHFSWNFIQGVIFPFEGSGAITQSFFLIKSNNTEMWPEASHYMILAFLIEITFIWLVYKKKGGQAFKDQ